MDSLLGWRIRGVVSPTSYMEVRRSPSSDMIVILFKKHSIPQALLTAVRALAEGLNAELAIIQDGR